MASANHALDSNVPADDQDADPLHGKQSKLSPRLDTTVYELTLNQVLLLQSWTSLSSTANLRPNPSYPPWLCSPLPLHPGP